MADKDGGPAFPREDYQASDAPGQRGMSLRDYFAGQALAGMMADPTLKVGPDAFAQSAYLYADAMLAKRAK